MRISRTPWWYYVIAVVLGALIGTFLVWRTRTTAIAPVGAPWFVSGVLFVLGVVVLVLAWQVHQYVTGKVKEIDVDKASTTLVLCKALAIAGAALAGYYGGELAMCIVWRDVAFYQGLIAECSVACAVTVIDMIIGIVGEGWCQLPPQEGPEHPNAKKRKKRRRDAVVAAVSRPADSAKR